jgi:cobalt-zinc-cadmium efflux system outer membrane protein
MFRGMLFSKARYFADLMKWCVLAAMEGRRVAARRYFLSLVCAALMCSTSWTQPPEPLTLMGLSARALDKHPKLQQASLAVDAARGRALQAGLYPNPLLQISGDELGDRTGPSGIWTAPWITQEIVTAKKLPLAKAAACKEVDQAALELAVQRFALLTTVRQAYFDVLALQKRISILETLVRLSDRTLDGTNAEAVVSKLDLAMLDFEKERFRAELEGTRKELPGAFRRLAAAIGEPNLPVAPLAGSLDDALPEYDLDRARTFVLAVSPELESAKIGIDRARLILARAQAEAKPNVTVGANFVQQGQNRSSDWGVSLAVPLPTWNRNQGNIQAAQAQLGDSIQEVNRVEADLVERVAKAFREYDSARQRALHYRDTVIPQARQIVSMSEQAFHAGQIEYNRLFESRRLAEISSLEYVKALSEAWKSAAVISGLALEEHWPPVTQPTATEPSVK